MPRPCPRTPLALVALPPGAPCRCRRRETLRFPSDERRARRRDVPSDGRRVRCGVLTAPATVASLAVTLQVITPTLPVAAARGDVRPSEAPVDALASVLTARADLPAAPTWAVEQSLASTSAQAGDDTTADEGARPRERTTVEPTGGRLPSVPALVDTTFACSDRSRSRRCCRPPRSSTSPRSSTRPASPTSRSPAAAASTRRSSVASRARGSGSARSSARTKTPLAMALRGRFLVGSRPVGGDFVRRFVATAAESGIDVFRLHDPLNDVSNLKEASEAITAAEREFDAGLVYSPGPAGETDDARRPGAAVARARRGARAHPRRVRGARATPHARARRGDPRRKRAAGRPLLPGRRRHRARNRDRGRPRRRRPDRRRGLPGRARPAPGIR